MRLEQLNSDPLINICMDTAKRKKQALIFCNTKRGAESQAEKLGKKLVPIGDAVEELAQISQKILGALESPTKQCKRLAASVAKGSAFHHAGLNPKQREVIELAFRAGTLPFISCTPTLAMGLDMPAFRSIVRDTKRFSAGKGWGMVDIPVLEYEQMSGRAGRPGKEDFGEAILIAQTLDEAKVLTDKYIHGEPEKIFSKLAVEPVLRTYLLSLIATQYIHDRASMYAFFDKTFYAHQYADVEELHFLLDKMLDLLASYDFIVIGAQQVSAKAKKKETVKSAFTSAHELYVAPDNDDTFSATPVGVRVAELYLDPLTAHFLIDHLTKHHASKQTASKSHALSDQGLLHLVCSTLELRPLLGVKTKDYDLIDEWLITYDGQLLAPEPPKYGYEYEEFLQAVKTAMCLCEWIDEAGEEHLFELFGIRPGELKMKIDSADWLLYSCEELGKLLGLQDLLTPLAKMRVRLEYGVKAELLGLMRFKGIGKKRARILYRNSVRDVGAIKKTEYSNLSKLIGPGMARKLKEQVGEQVAPEKVQVKTNKRKGQKSLGDWG